MRISSDDVGVTARRLVCIYLSLIIYKYVPLYLAIQGSDVDEGCLRRVVEGTEEACGKFTTYSLK